LTLRAGGKMITQLPKELNNFANLFYGTGNINLNIDFSSVYESHKHVAYYLSRRYQEIFNENISEQKIVDLLYKEVVTQKELYYYYQSSFIVISKCFSESINYINSLSNEIDYKPIDKVEYCRSLFQELVIFLDKFERYLDQNHEGYGFGRRNIANSIELYYSTYYHLFNFFDQKTMASITTRPVAVFLIRQAIETRFKNALGVYLVRNANTNEAIVINTRVYIDFIYSRGKYIDIPVDKLIIDTVNKWTNNYIHTGLMPEIYKIWFAIKLIKPLFTGANNEIDGYDRDGSIVINREYFDNNLEEDFKRYIISHVHQLKKLNYEDIYFEKMPAEALIKNG
jgi:hypothetical protein